jgi:hypothetical protein
MDMLAITLLILGIIALGIWRKQLRQRRQMQLHDIIHSERMKAMDKGVPFEALEHESMTTELARMNEEIHTMGSDRNTSVQWIRLYALCLGLLFLFGGIAVVAGFPLIEDADMQVMWPIGFIPTLIGLGLLLFYGLSRGYEKRLN